MEQNGFHINVRSFDITLLSFLLQSLAITQIPGNDLPNAWKVQLQITMFILICSFLYILVSIETQDV